MTDIALPHAGRTGQATQIEQSRAIAEVYAAAEMAVRYPRDVQASLRAMQDSCAQKELADKAFWAFPRSGSTLTGASVYLARELARCWRHVASGVAELRRDDEYGQSEMLAYAWDMETNTRSSHIFVVPHKRDKKTGVERITDMRDIYENNANNGARRMRECIFSVLPAWFVEQAEAACRKTLESGGGIPLAERVANMIAHYRAIGINEDELVRKLDGRPNRLWTGQDLADLGIVFKSLKAREITRDEAFPPAAVTAEEIAQQAQRPNGTRRRPTTATTRAESPVPGGMASAEQLAELAELSTGVIEDDGYTATVLRAITGRDVPDPRLLTQTEADTVLTQLRGLREQYTGDDLTAALDHLVGELLEQQGAGR